MLYMNKIYQDTKQKLLIADDHEATLSGLKDRVLVEFPNALITCVSSYSEIFDKLRHNSYDILITDLKMEYPSPVTGIVEILKRHHTNRLPCPGALQGIPTGC
jgi:DNA-binding NarL/FixJ family response regulator